MVTSITDAQGNTTSFEYDVLGRVTKRINPDLTEVEVAYNDQNNWVTLYDELDHYALRYYDGLNHLIRAEWYLTPTVNLTEVYTYNYLDKVETKTDPGGHVYSCEYDSYGRPTKMINPDSTFRHIQYDDTTNTISVFNENQHKTEYRYDWVGNLLQVKEYTDSVTYYLTQYTYDSVGNLTSFTDANGNTTLYEYDSLFGVTRVTYPDSTVETFSYDAAGNVLSRTDFNGTTTFTYNALYQLTEVVYPDQSPVSFAYDLNGNCTLMTDPAGYTTSTYDNRNRLLSETRTIEGEPYTVGYTYDAASTLVSLTYPDQSVITYEYDCLNRLTTIPGYAQFTYNDSLLVNMTYGNGTITSYQYDNCDRPVSIHTEKSGTDLLTMNYHYDPVGNVTQLDYNRRQGEEWVQSTEIFGYDWLDRVVSAQGDYGVLSYSYDSVGNRLSHNGLTYTYNNMNQLISISDGTAFTYDQNGNTLTKSGETTWSYTYDARNLLTQVEKTQEIIGQYTYDGNGRRIQKTVWIDSLQDYQPIIYVYSGLNVIYERNLDTNQEATYIYGPTGRIAKKVSGLQDYYHTDQLGSTRLITDESGTIITDVEYTPFGEPTTEQEERYLYTGKERDATGLYYYGARYYDCETGRFTTRDPVAGRTHTPQSLNRYIYCLNNPLKYTDPLGLSAKTVEVELEEYEDPNSVFEFFIDYETLPGKLRELWGRLGLSADKIMELLKEYLAGILQKIKQNFLYTGTINFHEFMPLMSFLEAVVTVFGDVWGITGAFFCIEGMAIFGGGGQIGMCFVYHPDLGWAMFYYWGYLWGAMKAGGISIIAGFWTWHKERPFEFDDWEKWFVSLEGTGGAGLIGSGMRFENETSPPTITGWGIGVGGGGGLPLGVATSRARFYRARDWMIPHKLRGIIVPYE